MNERALLLVDDRSSNLFVARVVLQPLGVDVIEARSGEEALELARGRTLAAALLDVQMPEMDGFELARRLRAQREHADLSIVFVSACDEDTVRAGFDAKNVDYVAKPIEPTELRTRVDAIILRRQPR